MNVLCLVRAHGATSHWQRAPNDGASAHTRIANGWKSLARPVARPWKIDFDYFHHQMPNNSDLSHNCKCSWWTAWSSQHSGIDSSTIRLLKQRHAINTTLPSPVLMAEAHFIVLHCGTVINERCKASLFTRDDIYILLSWQHSWYCDKSTTNHFSFPQFPQSSCCSLFIKQEAFPSRSLNTDSACESPFTILAHSQCLTRHWHKSNLFICPQTSEMQLNYWWATCLMSVWFFIRRMIRTSCMKRHESVDLLPAGECYTCYVCRNGVAFHLLERRRFILRPYSRSHNHNLFTSAHMSPPGLRHHSELHHSEDRNWCMEPRIGSIPFNCIRPKVWD